MKKIVKRAAVAILAGLSFSASAWWGGGPYGYPYWGGYAPVVAAPVLVAPASQEQLNSVYNSWGYSPFLSGPGDFMNDSFMPPMHREMFKRSEAERELSLKESEARREAFRSRAAAQRAAMDARRQAWRESVRSSNYTPFGYGAPYAASGPIASSAPVAAAETAQAEQPAAVAEAPTAPAAAPAAPAPQPVAAAPAPAAQ